MSADVSTQINEKQWSLRNRGQIVGGELGLAGADIQLMNAWPHDRGHHTVVIAFIDHGFECSHAALRGSAIPKDLSGVSFGHENATEIDPFHGTHLAAIAIGNDPVTGFTGIAPDCSWLPITAPLGAHYLSDRIVALNWFAELVKDSTSRFILNLSWEAVGADESSGRSDPALYRAVKEIVDNGALVVAAAGNLPIDTDVWPRFPACYGEVITVAATDHRDRKTDFSAYGSAIDVSAPGYEIYSAWGQEYLAISGSSQAAPHAAGVLGLVWSKNPALDSLTVRSILETSCDGIEELNPEFVGKLGAGRINAARAVEATPPS